MISPDLGEHHATINGEVCVRNGCCACCVDTLLKLSLKEARFLRNNGTNLNAPVFLNGRKNRIGRDGRAWYELVGKCGLLLANGKCSAYEDPQRPVACGRFEPDSDHCKSIRVERGLNELISLGEIE